MSQPGSDGGEDNLVVNGGARDIDESEPSRPPSVMEIDDDSDKDQRSQTNGRSRSASIQYIDSFPTSTTIPQVIVPTLEELGYERSDYVKARPQVVRPQVVKVLDEIDEGGHLLYQVRLGDGQVVEVCWIAAPPNICLADQNSTRFRSQSSQPIRTAVAR